MGARLFHESHARRHQRPAAEVRRYPDRHSGADGQDPIPGFGRDRRPPQGLDPQVAGNHGVSRTPWLLVAAPMALLVVFFVVPDALPLSTRFLKSEAQQLTGELTLENYAFLFGNPIYQMAFVRTFVVGAGVGVLTVLLGYPLAYFLVRTRSPWKGLLIALSLAPLLASVVVRTYGWYIIL